MPDEYGNLTPEELAAHNGNKTTGVFGKVGGAVKKAASSVKNKVTDTANSVKTTVGNVGNAVANGVTQAKESIAEAGASVREAGAQAVGRLSEAADTVTEGAKNFANTAVDAVTGAYDATTHAISDFAGDAKDFTTNLAHKVGDATESGFEFVKETAQNVEDAAYTVYDSFDDMMSATYENTKDSVVEFSNAIANAEDSDGDSKKEITMAMPEFLEESQVAGWLGEIAERSINNNPYFQLLGYEIDIETSINPETVELVEEIALDVAQVGLGVLGFVPGFGEVADLASAAISVKQEDYLGAALDAASAIPFAGWASGAASIIKHGDDIADAFKAIKKLSNAVDAVDTAVDTAKAVENAGDIAKGVDNAVDAAKAIDNAADAGKAAENAADVSKAVDNSADAAKAVGNATEAAQVLDDGSVVWKNADGVVKQIDGKNLDEFSEQVQDMYNGYNDHSWQGKFSGQPENMNAGGEFKNRDLDLPQIDSDGGAITYREYDINEQVLGQDRDAERFVAGSDGNVYYTNDHYTTFWRIK